MKTTLIFGAILFLHSSLFARWSAIEHIDERDSLWIHGAISKERSLTVDLFQNKHVAYVRESLTKGGPYSWRYGRKDGGILYDSWVDSTMYTAADQMVFPPHSKPVITTDAQGRVHYAWSCIDAGTVGEVYYQMENVAGTWFPSEVLVSGASVNRPGNLAIAVNSNGNRRIIAYTCFEAGIRHLKVSITTDNGTSWDNAIDIGNNIGEDFPSVAIDRAGYFYVLYQQGGLKCQLLDNASPYSRLWEYPMGGVHGQCYADHVDGTISFANLHSGDLIYRYRTSGDTDSSTSHWYGMDTLLTGSTSELASISCYDSTVGIVSGLELNKDTLYFEQKSYSGTWDTTRLLSYGDQIYVGKCVDMDSGGYAHIIGNTAVSGPSIIKKDSVFYFTNRLKPGIVIIPDTVAIPDAGGTTNPGVPISYMHEVINRGNIVDTFGLYIANTKIDSIAALVRPTTNDTAFYPDTLFIYDTWPGDTDTVYLLIVPSDTCWPCFVDTTKFIGYSLYEPTARDSAVDTTRVIADIVLLKEAVSPPAGDTVNPLDTITYRIIVQDTWSVHIDSLTIYDLIHPDFDTAWVESTTAISDTHYFTLPGLDTLVWIVKDLSPSHTADTLFLKGIVRSFDCADVFPREVTNFAYTEGTPCVRGDTTDIVAHTAVITPVELMLSKTGAPADSDTVYPGDIVTYYIECRNDSQFPAKNVVIRDFLDDDVETVTYASDSPVITDTYVEWNIPCLLAASAYHCTLQVRVGSEYKAVYERFDTLYNSAAAWGDTGWVRDTAYSDTTIHFIKRKLDVHFHKSADPPCSTWVARGDSILYTLTFYNDTSANSIMRDIEVRDTLDPNIYKADHITTNNGGFVYTHPEIFWTVDSLAPGDTFVGTYYGFVDSSAAFGDSALNWYRVNYPGVFDSTSDTTVHYIGRADLDLVKTAAPPTESTVYPGDTITYFIDCTNNGEVTAKNITITDTLDDDVDEVTFVNHPLDTLPSLWSIIWHVDSLPVDSTYYCTLKVTVGYEYKAIYERIDTVYNWSWLHADTLRTPDSVWSDTTVHYIHRKLDVNLDKSALPPSRSVVQRGDSIYYRLWCHNDTSANSVMRDLTVTDNLHPLIDTAKYIGGTHAHLYVHPVITWTIDSLAPGDSFVGDYYGFVNDSAPLGDSVLNHMRFVYPDIIDSTSDTTVHYIGKELIDKRADPLSGSWVAPGDTIHYSLTYYNFRVDTVRSVTIIDTVDTLHLTVLDISPPDSSFSGNILTWNIGDIPPLDSFEVWFDAQVKITAPLGDTIPNIGAFNAADTGSDSTEHYIGTYIPELGKISIPDSGAIVNPGDTIQYELHCHNGGNLLGTDVVVIDTVTNVLSAWTTGVSRGNTVWTNAGAIWVLTWTIDSFKVDSSEWVTYEAEVMDAVGDSVLNFAISRRDSSNKTIHYIEEPLLWIDKDAELPYPDSSVVYPGDTIRYYIDIENRGTDTAHQVIVWDHIDTSLIDAAINISPPESLYTGDYIVWSLHDLPPGYSTVLRYDGIIKSPVSEGTIVNACWGSGIDADTAGDTTYHFIRQQRAAKWAEPPSGSMVRPGSTLRFWLRYSSGNRDTVITIIDTLSPYLDTPPTAISAGGTWDGTAITWVDTVSQGLSDTVWFVATVSLSAPLGDTVWNHGVFESQAGTFVGGPTWHPIGLPDVKLEKTAVPVSGSIVTAGDTINYTLRCSNLDGTDTARQIVVYDTLSQYFVSPGVVTWNIGDVPPSVARDTTFLRAIMLNLPDTAWGDTIFNIAILLSPSDPDVDTTRDTTYHILRRTEFNMIKRSYKLSGFLLPESSCVYPDSSFYYDITIDNVGDVPARDVIILDTIRNSHDCVDIDSIMAGPDSVWWHGNNALVPPNVVGWWIPEIGAGDRQHIRFKVHVRDIINFKNEVLDTVDVLHNTCWIEGRNVALDSSNTHVLFVGFKAGVEIEPDTALHVILGQTILCTLRVKNTGSFTDSISLIGKNLASGWQIFLGGTVDSSYLLPDVPRDTIQFLPVTLVAPYDTSSNTALVIARSKISERIGKTVEDTAVITITSGRRIVNIIVEPDTSATTSGGNTREYRYMRVINLGNDIDVVDIAVDTLSNGWSYDLTHENGTSLIDTDADTKLDIGAILPNDTTRLLLRVTPPGDITWGVNASHMDTLVIWGTSSHEDPQDSIVSLRDSATVITKLSIDQDDIHNYPNPFRKDEGTTFVFAVRAKTKCTLTVYTRKGEVINVVFDGKEFEAGRHEWPWDATNQSGNKIAAETYLYTFKSGGEQVVKKLVVLPASR